MHSGFILSLSTKLVTTVTTSAIENKEMTPSQMEEKHVQLWLLEAGRLSLPQWLLSLG